MSYAITEFMWGFQPHFRNAMRRDVEGSFALIGMPVESRVLLVGVAASPHATHPICVEPEHGPFKSGQLVGLEDEAERRYRDDPESEIWHTDRRLHEMRQEWLRNRNRADAISDALGTAGSFEGFEFFTSAGTTVGNYHVHTCVGLPAATLAAVPQFEAAVVDRFYVGRSLPHTLVDECLRRADAELYKPDAGAGLRLLGDRNELVRAAATRFVDGTCLRVTRMSADLTQMLDEVAAQYYERGGAHGRLLLTEAAKERCDTVFTPPVSLYEHRTIRKLLETTTSKRALVGDFQFVYGLGVPTDAATEIELAITDHATWELRHSGRRMIRMSYGKPTMPTTPLPREQVDDVVVRTIGHANLDAIWGLVDAALQLGHGTTIVISADPATEAARLGGQAIAIEPRVVDAEEVSALSGIDGALVIGGDGRCHAFGVILDGVATADGSRGRGSRYNSAARYQRTSTVRAAVVVVSDDGSIDIFPQLRPRVDREAVELAVLRFENACGRSDPASNDEFGDSLHEIEQLEFYLNQHQCDRVNAAQERESELRRTNGQIVVVRPPVVPHPDMDDTYWL